MARRRADRVVIHRLELGLKEREYLEGALTAYQINRVITPMVAGMSDISFMIVLGTLLKLYWPDIEIPTGEPTMEETIDAITGGIRRGIERAREERAQTGEATLDESTGLKDFLGRLIYNLTNPNWGRGGPGVREAIGDLFD